MYNTYFSSAMSLRSKGSLSFSFNDYCQFLNERIEKSSYRSCNCCALSIHGMPIYPRFLYGLRQSSLIHCSASRRLILVGFDRYCRLPLCDLDRGCYGVSCSVKESSVCRRRKTREERFGCMAWEGNSESCDSGVDESAEAMLSLLTEELSEKFVGRSAGRRDLVEKRGRVVDERSRKEKDCVQAKSLQRNSKGACKSITVKSREKFHQQSGRSEASSRTENDGIRREGSGCSSYYSMSSSGDIESDTDVQVKHADIVGESSNSYSEKELRSSREDVLEVDVGKQFKRYDEDVGRYREISRRRNGGGSAVGSDSMQSGHERNLRRQAEKKITEVSVGPVDSREESSQRFSRKCEVKESGMEMVANHEKRFSGRKEGSTEDVLEVDVRKQFKRYDEDVGRYGEISRQRNAAGSAVGSDSMRSGHEWNLRRQAENKITEVTVGTVDSREESSQRFSRKYEVKESDMEMVANHEKRFNGREEGLTEDVLDVDVRKQFKRYDEDVGRYREISRQRNAAGSAVGSDSMRSSHEWNLRRQAENKITEASVGPVDSREELSPRFSRKYEVNESGTEMVANYEERFSGREEGSTSAVNLVGGTTESNRQSGFMAHEHGESRRKSQQVQSMSEIHAIDLQRASSSRKQFNGKEGNLTSAINLVEETGEGNKQTVNENIEKTDLRRKPRQLTISKDSNIEMAYTSQMLFEAGMNIREENSTSFQSSIQKSGEQHSQSYQGVDGNSELIRESQDLTNISEMTAGGTGTITTSETLSGMRVSGRERNSDSILVDLVHEGRQYDSLSGKRIVDEVGQRKESRRPVKALSYPRSSYRTPFHLIPHARVPTEDDRNSTIMLMPPPSQLVGVRTGHARIQASGEFSESSSSSLFTNPPTQNPASPHEVNVATRTDETFGEHPSPVLHDDALVSADHFERSSSQFIGEFVEKVQDEMLTSKIQEERTSSETMSVNKDTKYIGPSQHVFEGLQLKKPGSRRSSDVSGSKGPPDEMWDVVDPSLLESSLREAPEEGTSTSGSAIARRTGRSFWNIVADIVRMRWATRSETTNSALKSGRSSSNVSVKSEAWFSGREPDENDDEDARKRQRGIPKEPISVDQPQQSKASTRSQTEASEATISHDRISDIETDTPSYSDALERGSTSQDPSLASGEERLGWNEDGGRDQGIPSTIASVDSSLQLPTRRFIRSPAIVEQIRESTKAEVSISDVKEHMEQPTRERLTEVHGTDGKDGELKRRKFQRNMQVPQDRFDEWEKAYKLETEQGKIDKIFMREALLEAQKAADIWEVPVGAVLVRNGEIIARGCNLVEELRDSTAHAEMICIREASNLLRTWRLSDTTLYVTLEPCPMCAGAILQARIDAVVWGAPNKLLGADGSWVRLFPSGGEAGSSSDLRNQPAGPIHPFHPKIAIRRGVLETECAEVMQQFFQLRRMKKEKKPVPEPQPPCLPVSTHPSKFLSKIHDMFSIMFCL